MSNSLPFDESFARFEALFEQIAEKDRKTTNGPTIVKEAEDLVATVINAAEATAEDCWARMWDKPLYAHIRTGIANEWCRRSNVYLAGFDAWKAMDKSVGQFRIDRKQGGRRSPNNFTAIGQKVLALVDMEIPIERLYSILCSADALRKWASSTPFPMKGEQIDVKTVRRLSGELGYGWGPVTTLHFLTDTQLFGVIAAKSGK